MYRVPTGSKYLHIINRPIKRTVINRVRLVWMLLLCTLLSGVAPVYGQSKKELEDKRRRLLREIELTDKLLKKTTTSREATYDRYITLQKQIERRERLVQTIQAEIVAANKSIDRSAGVITALENDLHRMREEYGRMVRNAFRRKMLTNPLVFIFSAESLNQAFRRWLFLRKYDRLRKEQSKAIAETQEMLRRKMSGLETARQEKENLLQAQQNQQATLTRELEQKDQLLKTLAQDESRLKKELAEKQKAHEALNQAIERIIQEEVQRQLEAARKPRSTPAKPSGVAAEESPEKATAEPAVVEDVVSKNFTKQRGRLPWPVENGIITRPFGRQKHPTIKSVEITNNGIDIRTEDGSSVKAVYEGRVAGVQFIPGHDYTVILQHGNFYTVYSNLSETFVSKGDQVAHRQSLGRVSANPITGSSELHFEIWQQKERMNPAAWIKK